MIVANLSALNRDAIASPFWVWDTKSGRYRDRTTGRFLSQTNLEKLQRRHIALIEKDIETIGELLIRRQISLETWQETTGRALKSLWLQEYALGRGGVKQVEPTEWLAVGRQLREQYSYLRGFSEDINRGYSVGKDGRQIPMSESRFRARLNMYSKAAKTSFEMGKQEVAKSQGKMFMQRFINSRHPCRDCPKYARMGIQPIGALPLPGQRCQCLSACRCSVRYFGSLTEIVNSKN